jgi:hypothetical protein
VPKSVQSDVGHDAGSPGFHNDVTSAVTVHFGSALLLEDFADSQHQFLLRGGLFRERALIRSNGGVRRRDLSSGSVTAKTELAPLRGRPARVARKDQAILAAAREVLLADPTAPISAVAERVDVRAPYHRYESKEDLPRTL